MSHPLTPTLSRTIAKLLITLTLVTSTLSAADTKPLVPMPPRHHRRTYIVSMAIIAAGAAAGATIAIIQNRNASCPHIINGYPYDGTPPCPNPVTYDPGGSKRHR